MIIWIGRRVDFDRTRCRKVNTELVSADLCAIWLFRLLSAGSRGSIWTTSGLWVWSALVTDALIKQIDEMCDVSNNRWVKLPPVQSYIILIMINLKRAQLNLYNLLMEDNVYRVRRCVLRQNKLLPKCSLLRHNSGYRVDSTHYLSARVQRCSTDCLISFKRVTGLRAPYVSAKSRFLSSVSTSLLKRW